MPTRKRTLFGLSLDGQIPVTYMVAGLAGVAAFGFAEHSRIGNNERVNGEQDKAIAQIQQQMEADRKANQEIRESVIAFNGKMDTLNTKIDNIRSMMSINAIKADAAAR